MERLIEIGVSNAAVACVLAVVAALAGLVVRRPAVCHALWLLVLLKLITPPLVSVRIRPPDRQPAHTTPEQEPELIVAEGPAVEADLFEMIPIPPEAEDGADAVAEAPPAAEPDGIAEPRAAEPAVAVDSATPGGIAWWQWIAGVWCSGSLAWFVLASWRVWRFSDALRHARPAPAGLRDCVARLAGELGLARIPEVRLVAGRVAPMVWGLGRPMLLVPEGLAEQVGEAGLRTLLAHELAHVRRRDHLVRWLEFVALGLYWWNPVAWYARRELREAEEQCCDAWVVDKLPGAGRTYATALVDVLDFLSGAREALPALASGIGQISDLKRRLTMILRGSTPPGLGGPASLAVLGLALFLLPLVPSWARADDRDPKVVKAEDVIRGRAVGGDDLKRIEDELRKKLAEIEMMKKKLEDVRKLRDEAAKRAAEEARKAAAEAKKKAAVIKDEVKRRVVETTKKGGTTIRIEISGLTGSKAEMEELAKALEKALPGKEKRVIILGGEGGFRFMFPTPTTPKPPTPPTPPTPGAAPRPGAPGFPGGGAFGGGFGRDPRMQDLEKKLDSIMRELEQLRKEMRRPGGGPGPGGPGRGPGRPGGEGGFDRGRGPRTPDDAGSSRDSGAPSGAPTRRGTGR